MAVKDSHNKRLENSKYVPKQQTHNKQPSGFCATSTTPTLKSIPYLCSCKEVGYRKSLCLGFRMHL